MMRRLLLLTMTSLLLTAGAAGCGKWVTPVEEMNIRCDNNQQCPSEFYCNESGSCAPTSEGGPPVITFDGIRVEGGGSYAKSLTLPTGERTRVEYKLSNTGKDDALGISATFESESCPAFNFDAVGLGSAVGFPAGTSQEDDKVVEPSSDCASPSEVTVRMETRSQKYTGTFELTLE